MKEPTELQKQKYKRFTELLERGKQRYLDAGGNPRSYRAGIKGQDYLTDEERDEAKSLLRQVFGIKIIDGYVQCSGQSWKLPENSPLLQEQA